MIKRIVIALLIIAGCQAVSNAQIDYSRALSGLFKTVQAVSISDQQMSDYVKEYIEYMDKENNVLPESSPYTQRLRKLTEGLTSVEGLPLNFKVYNVKEVNAFACADGSVRVFSALMDIMDDDELLGVIGHEIGHVAHHDSKKAFKQALLTSALKDAIGATSSKLAVLTDSQLGTLGEALASASYSKKQENKADEYGYNFLKSHGKNPIAMAKSFKKLKQVSGSTTKASKLNQLFSSHPDLDARIKKMEKRARKDGYTE